MTLTLPVVAWADLSNTASVVYRDATGASYSGVSNTVWVTVTTQTPPPTPDLSGLDGRTLTVQDEISFNYTAPVTGFDWVFQAQTGASPSPGTPGWRVTARAATLNYSSAAPRLNLAQFNLAPGPYQITVIARNGAVASTPATARITLVDSSLSGVKVYPNPWRSDRFSGDLTFSGLTGQATVKIFTVSAHHVKTLNTAGGSVPWDLRNEDGQKVASGIYLYLITDVQGRQARGQFAIIK